MWWLAWAAAATTGTGDTGAESPPPPGDTGASTLTASSLAGEQGGCGCNTSGRAALPALLIAALLRRSR